MAKKKRPSKQQMVAREIESTSHVVRGQRVMLDSDLAKLYGVTTTRLNE